MPKRWQCLFCCKAEPEIEMSDEDVISQWISDVLTADVIGDELHAQMLQGLDSVCCWPQRGSKLLKGKVVCTICNNTWMSRTEGRFRKLMSPAILGSPIAINMDSQALVASWIALKAMTLEAVWRTHEVFSQHERSLFAVTQTPSVANWVRIARIEIQRYPIWVRRVEYGSHPSFDRALCITFVMGALGVQLVRGSVLSNGDVRASLDATSSSTTLWPIQEDTVWWTPRGSLNERYLQIWSDPLGDHNRYFRSEDNFTCSKHDILSWPR